MDWLVVLVKPNRWMRANEPGEKSTEARIHVIPVSFDAYRFVGADTQLANNDHLTQIGWNPSWVKIGTAWVRAYRPNAHDENESRALATKMIAILNQQLAESREVGYPKITYVGLGKIIEG